MDSNDATQRRPAFEVVAILAAGGIHVATELTTSLAVSRAYNAAACVLFCAYVTSRATRDRSLVRAWGFRLDNLRRASVAYALLAVLAATAIYAVGTLAAKEPELVAGDLVLYLAWGLAQQFALQNLLAGNLARLMAGSWASTALASLLFAASHFPRLELAGAALIGGVAFVVLYRRFPNLFAAGAAHGVVGWMIFGCWGLD